MCDQKSPWVEARNWVCTSFVVNTTSGAFLLAALATMAAMETARAGDADVIAAELTRAGAKWTVTATIAHADEGWEHYANAFEVLAPDGTVLATRVLYHPHVQEQPFTRSLNGVTIPADVTEITVRAGDSVHGTDGGRTVTLAVPQ